MWRNPLPEQQWDHAQSLPIVGDLMTGRLYPPTLAGLDDAMRDLTRKR